MPQLLGAMLGAFGSIINATFVTSAIFFEALVMATYELQLRDLLEWRRRITRSASQRRRSVDFAAQRPRDRRIHPETVWLVEERVPQASVEDHFLECEPWGVLEVKRTTRNVTVVPVVHRQNTTLRATERLKPGPNAVVPGGRTAREHDEPYVGIGDRGRCQDRDDSPLRHTGHGDVIRGNAGCSEPRDLAGNHQCIGPDIGAVRPRLADDDESTIGQRLDRVAPPITGAHGAGGAQRFDDPAVHVDRVPPSSRFTSPGERFTAPVKAPRS